MIIVITIVAFLLEHALSLYTYNTVLIPWFVISSFVVLYPFFYNKYENYFKYALIIGLSYDVIFTNTLFLNMFLFTFIAFVIHKINLYLVNNFINIIIMTIMTIVTYLTISYIILVVIGYLSFSWSLLFKNLYSSIIINVIFNLILYLITEKVSAKYKILKVN